MRRALGCLALALWAGSACAATATLTQKQSDARQRQGALRARIEALQEDIDRREAARRDAAGQLKASESAISASNRRLADLGARQDETEHELQDILGKIEDQKGQLGRRQHELGEQLRAQYAGGLSPWAALLSGDNPQEIGRDLGYLGYVTKAQADAVRAVRQALDALTVLQAQAKEHKQALDALAQETKEEKKTLEAQKAERQQVLDRIESELKAQRGQASRLKQNDEHLSALITDLEAAIAKEREAARIAEEKRRAEAARKAEEARRAAQAAQAAREKAQRERDQRAAEQARLQVERARAQARAQEEAAAVRPDQAASAGPAGGFSGLPKTVPYPVNSSDVLGKFGAERPDGGLWRGIVLRAPEGTAIKAVGPGRVVYANWLGGFGNIMIIDHGAKYLSVYAYNQSLLKRVGDIVQAGDTIATVGATGGQVDSGLYFEIRHQGVPVNPLLWLRH